MKNHFREVGFVRAEFQNLVLLELINRENHDPGYRVSQYVPIEQTCDHD